jgi:hypothetical protein
MNEAEAVHFLVRAYLYVLILDIDMTQTMEPVSKVALDATSS